VFINTWCNCVGELLSACCSVMLLLNSGAPALEVLAVLNFLSMLQMWCSCTVWGETVDIDTKRCAASCKHSWTSLHGCCRSLERVSCHKIFIIFLMLYYFILYFTSYSYLDSILSPSLAVLLDWLKWLKIWLLKNY
jgi:hypothetical protein